VVDLLVRYLAGIQPQVDGTILVDPLPFDVASFSLSQVVVRGRELAVHWDAAAPSFRVDLDGRRVHESGLRQKVVLAAG
jgi:hypothetical protein